MLLYIPNKYCCLLCMPSSEILMQVASITDERKPVSSANSATRDLHSNLNNSSFSFETPCFKSCAVKVFATLVINRILKQKVSFLKVFKC